MQTVSDITGLSVAITGGTSGLGLALVRRLAAGGARIAFVARSAPAVMRIAKETGAHGIVGDIRSKDDIYAIALQITGTLGGRRVLNNNASSLGATPLAPLADTDCEDFEQALVVNVLGAFRLTKALFGALAAAARNGDTALVINISSDASLRQMTAIWAEEAMADGVRFVSIDPGDMDTPLHALAVPDADPLTLKRPEHSAGEIVDAIRRASRARPSDVRRQADDCR